MEGTKAERIVIINDRSAMVGGASNLACLLARKLEQSGIDTTFFAGDGPSPDAPIGDMVYVRDNPLMDKSTSRAFTQGLYNRKAYLCMRRTIEKYDTPSTIYHVHGWSKILSPSIFQTLNRVRQRTILHAHDYFLACPNGGFANFQKTTTCALKPMSAKCLATQCDKRGPTQKVWRTSRHMLRENLFPIKTQPANLLLIHEGMRTYFDRAGIAASYIRTIRNPADAILPNGTEPWLNKDFFFIGRLEPEKGVEDAAEASRQAGVRLHVIGDGALRSKLQTTFPNVILHGWKNKEEMRPLLKHARAVVISSRIPEPFGLVAIEAIASGIPIIISDAALLAPEIVNSGCGLAFSSGSIASLCEMLTSMRKSDQLIQSMNHNCQIHGNTLAQTTESWVDAIKGVYSEVLIHANGHAPLEQVRIKKSFLMTKRAAK
ncbi:glycosyltransferase family 4 protein [Ahrensia sp. 13_GOM-1096m]|uniref:glycosyltransferase family 4 protein n=1 Tax=Ahrensia sp. 13_GOM-1096m TaxID=1380380 RepID=UPI000688E0AD|nr:glycosyltransferase family 4 protein [Ahrensia sp. 13_GOM-1096m]